MTEPLQAYDKFNPGDLIAAERMNELQVSVRKDIHLQVGKVQQDLDEYKATPIDAALLGGKTPDEWTKLYDERYIQRSEIKNGWGEYRRYFKQISRPVADPDPAIIEHNLRRYPVVSLFQLDRLGKPDELKDLVPEGFSPDPRFVVYYAGRRDPIAEKLQTQGADTVFWGDALDMILEQFELSTSPTQTFDDVLNDLWGKMFDPGLDQDNFRRAAYTHSRYIQIELLNRGRTVQELKSGGIWNDLRVAMRPKMIPASIDFNDSTADVAQTNRLEVFHLSQNALAIKAANPIDVMVLLRT